MNKILQNFLTQSNNSKKSLKIRNNYRIKLIIENKRRSFLLLTLNVVDVIVNSEMNKYKIIIELNEMMLDDRLVDGVRNSV